MDQRLGGVKRGQISSSPRGVGQARGDHDIGFVDKTIGLGQEQRSWIVQKSIPSRSISIRTTPLSALSPRSRERLEEGAGIIQESNPEVAQPVEVAPAIGHVLQDDRDIIVGLRGRLPPRARTEQDGAMKTRTEGLVQRLAIT